MRNLFTKEEKILCAYIALYDDSISIEDIEYLINRSTTSINMKIQNYAALFDFLNVKRNNKITPLSGKKHGESGRMTDRETIEPLIKLGKDNLLRKCKDIIIENRKNKVTGIGTLEQVIKNIDESFKIILKNEIKKVSELNNNEWAITIYKNKIRIHFGNFIVFSIENGRLWLAIDAEYINRLNNLSYWEWDINDYPEYKKSGVITKNGLFNGSIEEWNKIEEYHYSVLKRINEKGMKLNKRTKYSNDNRVILMINNFKNNDLIISEYEISEMTKIHINNEEYVDIKNITETEKKSIIKSRLGQNIFRDRLLKKYSKCQLCQISNEKVLIASHVKSWKESDNNERLDVNNGLLLCANHDALFDNHLITFDSNGKIIISEKELLNINESMNINMDVKQEIYMKKHKSIFENKNA